MKSIIGLDLLVRSPRVDLSVRDLGLFELVTWADSTPDATLSRDDSLLLPQYCCSDAKGCTRSFFTFKWDN